ncbi:hypothetical protein HZA86_02795 [Candidatus Uhrbacteria bacterium]|nr:hypothetical protein [Candidatus Uhrbacteria bacterium]
MPLSLLLIPYILFLAFYALWSLVLMFHVFRYSFLNMQSWLLTILHGAVTILLLSLSVAAIATIDWSQQIPIPIMPSISYDAS